MSLKISAKAKSNQLHHGKHHIQFCNLLSAALGNASFQTVAAVLLQRKMFRFDAYGRFLIFSAFDLSPGTDGVFLLVLGLRLNT